MMNTDSLVAFFMLGPAIPSAVLCPCSSSGARVGGRTRTLLRFYHRQRAGHSERVIKVGRKSEERLPEMVASYS